MFGSGSTCGLNCRPQGNANKIKAMPAASLGCCHNSNCKIGYGRCPLYFDSTVRLTGVSGLSPMTFGPI